jgi:hypothetical protein
MKALVIVFSALLSLFLFGCGGSGGGGNGNQVEFVQGAYSGTWTSTNSWNGTSSIQIAPNGSVSGTFFNQTLNLTGTIEGDIVSDGSFGGTITIDGDEYNGDGLFELSNNDDVMTGHMTYQNVTFNFNFTRQP